MASMLMKKMATAASACAALLLSACGSAPDFMHEPPASYRVPLPAGVDGVWAREGKDNGERVRVSAQSDGALRIDFFTTGSSSGKAPQEPLFARTLRFDNTDWLLIDMRQLSASEGSQYKGIAPFRLIKYILQDTDRLCGIEPSAQLFAEGIQAGKLKGDVVTYSAPPGPLMHVTVTATGEEWVKWWSELPASAKTFAQPVFCFRKKDSP